MTLVHGDDFVSVGSTQAADQFRKQLQARFDIKTQVIGGPTAEGGARASSTKGSPDDQRVQEGRVLNHVVRWTPGGVGTRT